MAARRTSGSSGIWLAALPLACAVLLFEVFGPFAGPLSSAELAVLKKAIPPTDFLPGEITFLSVVALHIAICAATLRLAVGLLRRTPGAATFGRTGLWVAAAVGAAIAALFLLLDSATGGLAYRAYQSFFTETELAPGFSAAGPLHISPLSLAILLPTILGVVAVAMTSAAAHAQLHLFRRLFERPGGQAARVRQLHGRLKQCLYALSLVLVTATVSASLFFHLPTRFAVIPKSNGEPLMARLSAFASEMSFFWGLIFSLTLAAAVGLPLVLLHARVRRALDPPFPGMERGPHRKLIEETGLLQGGREQVKFFVTLLAPLCAGPAANLLQAAVRL